MSKKLSILYYNLFNIFIWLIKCNSLYNIVVKLLKKFKNFLFIIWGLGIGDWGLGIGDWGLGPIPNPQSPIPIKTFK